MLYLDIAAYTLISSDIPKEHIELELVHRTYKRFGQYKKVVPGALRRPSKFTFH